MIASAPDPSFLMQMTDENFMHYRPKALRGDLYAINKMIQYYSEHDDDEQVVFWCRRRDEVEK